MLCCIMYVMPKALPENSVKNVADYIRKCPPEVRDKLNKVRAIILKIAPGARERVDYFQMPGYSYEGYDYDGMFVWFSYKKPFIRLHLRPPVVEEHKKELTAYATTKSIVSFPDDIFLPMRLINKLIRASLNVMKKKTIK